jgi:hypothetical protein
MPIQGRFCAPVDNKEATTLSEIRRHAAGQHREFAKQIVPLEPAFGQPMQARIIRPLVARILAQQLK